jgi:apolipoprotein N-acyltransferase
MADAGTGMAFRAVGPLAPLQRAALWCAGLTGWRRYAMAWLLGALATAALSPIDLTPVLVVSFSGLIWIADGTTSRRGALLLGWCFGFGFFVAGLYWVAAALFVDIARFWWMVPFAVAGLPAVLAILPALAQLAAYEATERFRLGGSARILVFAAAWGVAEYARGHVLTGFPWNLMGYAWAGAFPGALTVLQSTALIGIYGLSVLTVTVAALPARLGDLDHGRTWAPLAALLLVAVAAAGGAWRLAGATRAEVPGVMLRLVQPSIPETLKNDPSARLQNFERLLALSAAPSSKALTDIVWPEAAAPPLLERFPAVRQRIAQVIPKGGLLLTGDERAEPLTGWPPRHFWNSLVAINAEGAVIATYDKAHLVPFGEYMPLRGILPVAKIAPSIGDFTSGAGPRTLDLPGLPPVSPMICYEVIFPGAVIDPADRPRWLLNITNDAWYGKTSGPFQHLAIARVRAVEEGLPLLRDANNGVSAVIDGYGRVLSRLDLDAVGVLDTPLPEALAPTLYESARDKLFWALVLSLLAIAGIISRFKQH